MVGAGTFAARSGAGAAVTVTGFVAAEAVNTESATALIAIGARTAINLLGDTGRTVAVVAHAAVVISGAAIAASIGAIATGIGATTFRTGLEANTVAITVVGIGER